MGAEKRRMKLREQIEVEIKRIESIKRALEWVLESEQE